MKILVVSATGAEISPLLKSYEACSADPSSRLTCHSRSQQLDFLITGIGMVATAYRLTNVLARNTYDLIVNAGISGCYDESIQIGQVVNVTEDFFPELGAEAGNRFLTLAEIGLAAPDEFPYRNHRLVNESFPEIQSVSILAKVRGITVNTIHGSESSIQRIRMQFNPQTESMEGAAFLYTCLSERIPCIQLRAISNYMEIRNKEAWDIPLAVTSLNNVLDSVLKEII